MLASSNFSALGLDNWILRNISCLEYTTPTIVQEKVIPKILKSSSTVAISPHNSKFISIKKYLINYNKQSIGIISSSGML